MGFWEKHEAIDFLKSMNELHPKGSETRWRYVVYLLGTKYWNESRGDLGAYAKRLLQRRTFHLCGQAVQPCE
jgi:hypothetical protein